MRTLFVAPLALLALIGCGSGADSLAEYEKRFQEAEANGRQVVEAAQKEAAPLLEGVDRKNEKALRAVYPKIIPVFENARKGLESIVTDMKAVTPPEGLAAFHEKLVAAYEAQVKSEGAFIEALKDGDQKALRAAMSAGVKKVLDARKAADIALAEAGYDPVAFEKDSKFVKGKS